MTASAFHVITVNSNYPSLKVVAGSNPPMQVLLYNADQANTIYLAGNNAVDQGNINISTPLPPLSSVTFDGAEDVYAFTLTGLTALLQEYPTGASYYTVQGVTPISQMGSVSGTPAGTIGSLDGFVFTPVTLAPVGPFASYDLTTYVYDSAPGAVLSPFCVQVQLQWFDDLISGIPVFEEDWYIWAGSGPPSPTSYLAGCGPMHGKYMTVNFIIPPASTSNAIVQYINVFGSNRPQPYSDWRQNGQEVSPDINGWTPQPDAATSFENSLLSVTNYTVPASQAAFFPLGLYAGPAWLSLAISTPGASTPVIASMEGLVGGQVPTANDAQPNTIYRSPNSGLVQTLIILPRAACGLFLVTTVTPMEISCTISAQQAA